ncbi:class I SAM-dependent methyltransferase [Acidovorax kalamii]|uniref:class I SAM-dependent methyltransferase n=1 Tax=Acidovorax kalamii TaxID=2004485 RepID=UPI002090DE93|nr:SAM-dependent methyltransferase [Acidovorax kalamii]MCO5356317.1 SAM-dependent methyltransferase [Acidovorax kalamii]
MTQKKPSPAPREAGGATRKKEPQASAPAAELSELRPGQSVELLKELHILTREGRLNQDSRRKLKQVYHLFNFIEPLLTELSADGGGPTLADHGAGKSYLGFILYDLYFKALGHGHIYGVETRSELVEKSRHLAQRLGFGRMSFLNLSVAESSAADELPAQIDVVTALHACDTATDDAIAFGLQKKARAMVLVPCCQAEMAACLRQGKALQLARTPLAELWRHPLHTRELGSQVTNVLRCLYLEASGYQVTVTELVGWEHSMKNELIIARYTGQKKRSAAERLRAILVEFGLEKALGPRFGLAAAADVTEAAAAG